MTDPVRRAVSHLLSALATSVALTAAAGPATAQQLPADVAARLVSSELGDDGWTVRAEQAPSAALLDELGRARRVVEEFFGAPYPEPLAITVAPDRQTFTAVLRAEWGVPETECWMVATGVADFVVMLSPQRWSDQACEHDPGDDQHRFDLLVHELTHAYHGQRNPTRDFTGAEEVGWFAEGLAVLVAGQLERDRLADPAEAIERGLAPERLADAWSGRYRYAVSGSIVALIDREWGRRALIDLLGVTDQAAILARLGTTEPELLARWRAAVTGGP
jgi:hypothetical protein